MLETTIDETETEDGGRRKWLTMEGMTMSDQVRHFPKFFDHKHAIELIVLAVQDGG